MPSKFRSAAARDARTNLMQSTYSVAMITLMSCVSASWGSLIWRGRNFVLISRLHNICINKTERHVRPAGTLQAAPTGHVVDVTTLRITG